jgi:uncharacterized protein (TIGR02118 family)
MIRYSVLYPATEGATFDHDYYRDHHVPLCRDTWKPLDVAIDRGVDGPYVAAVHFVFASHDALQQALAGAGTAAIRADVANYTTIVPVRQISDIVDIGDIG